MPALSRHTAARLAGVTAALFAACTAITVSGLLDGMDHDAAAAMRRIATHTGDVVLSWFSLPASVQLSAGWLALLAVVASRRPWWRGRVMALATVVVAGVALEVAMKILIDHPGPHPGRGVIALGGGELGRGSFPSGHAFRGTTLAFGTALLARATRRPPALVVAAGYAALLAWTTVYLNQHWTSDVIGGVLLGLTAAVMVAAVPAAVRQRRT
ncbi:MAG TPA: phosphatase PAP2 family protein [Candidatus Dormibacteraeota bacterium]|jgi:undecaprenyl-diphosphatase|nr:phosphatase PAP2 family protein [Candidatus Dormibacteraeota bacterium]